MDWDFRVNLVESTVDISHLTVPAPDTSILGRTITKLVEAFRTSPSPFMQPKIRGVLTKRDWTVQRFVTVIIQGTKDANIYDTLNRPNFDVNQILNAAPTIDERYPAGVGGVYFRYHVSGSDIPYWKSNTEYGYVGKTVNFKNRFGTHPYGLHKYSDLSRNSTTLIMCTLCVMEDEDYRELFLLVDQIFICLLQTYRADIMRPLTGIFPTRTTSTVSTTNTVNKTRNPAKHAEAMHIAHYFDTVSEAVFSETGFHGGIKRALFGVSLGANHSSLYFGWSQKSEQILWIRQDTYRKYRERGQTVPMTVFRTAKTKRAHFTKVVTADLYRHKNFTTKQETLYLNLPYNETLRDGTKCPREDAQYHVVFEVRTDGLAHPHHWSRLPDIGGFHNRQQARSLAVRVEWEHPPNPRKWRYRYVHSKNIYSLHSFDAPGTYKSYRTAIGLLQWLFDTNIDNSAPDWIPRIGRTAYVLQTSYDYFKQSIEITPQKPYPTKDLMKDCRRRPLAAIIADYQQHGFLNVNGEFAKLPNPPDPDSAKNRGFCNLCVLLGNAIRNIGLSCDQVPGQRYCRPYLLYGRPVCSWSATPGLIAWLTDSVISGTASSAKRSISSDFVKNTLTKSRHWPYNLGGLILASTKISAKILSIWTTFGSKQRTTKTTKKKLETKLRSRLKSLPDSGLFVVVYQD
jgi:hypothetical protein